MLEEVLSRPKLYLMK